MTRTNLLVVGASCLLMLAACGNKKGEASQQSRDVTRSQSVHMAAEAPEPQPVEVGEVPSEDEAVPPSDEDVDALDEMPVEPDEAVPADDDPAPALAENGDDVDEDVVDDGDEGDEGDEADEDEEDEEAGADEDEAE